MLLAPVALLAACSGDDATPTIDPAPDDTAVVDTETVDDTGSTDPYVWPEGAVVLRGRVLDVEGARGPVTVVLDGDTIDAVLDGTPELPPGVDEIAAADDSWIVPGLIDPHVHLFLSGTSTWVGDTLEAHLRQSLAHGVTSVVDVGGPVEAFALRDRIAAGEILGPAILATGPMVTAPGSHPCEEHYDPSFCALAESEAEGRAAVEALLAAGSDGVKVALADADFTPWPTPRLPLDALEGAVGAARDAGGLAVAHVDEEADTLDALDAGVEHLAHPVFGGMLAPASVSRVAADATATHTTLGAFAGTLDLLDGGLPLDPLGVDPRVSASWALDAANPQWFDPLWLSGSALWLADAQASVEALDAAGATLLPASDAGYLYVGHGIGLHLELARLEAEGWDPERLLVAATFEAASAVGWTDRGRVAAGQRADLLVLDGDPRTDLARLAAPHRVVVAGRAEAPEAWADTDPLVTAASGADGTFCLDGRDCTSGACDRVAHRCTTPCTAYGLLDDPCGADGWCGLDEAISGAPVCRDVRTCDLYDPSPCAPEPYEERCVPLDLDTAGCFPAGPREAGQRCDPADPALTCAAGLYCSVVDQRCYELCDPASDPDPCPGTRRCVEQQGAGEPWFGLCL